MTNLPKSLSELIQSLGEFPELTKEFDSLQCISSPDNNFDPGKEYEIRQRLGDNSGYFIIEDDFPYTKSESTFILSNLL